MIKLPKEVSPNPLVTSTVEIRYESSRKIQNLFPLVFSAFIEELPNFDHHIIPKEVREKQSGLKYVPEYTLSNENYKLSFSDLVLSFENISGYRLWGSYFPFITKCVEKFFEIGHVEAVTRIGVRFASILNETDTAAKVIKNVPTIKYRDYTEKFERFSCNLKRDKINLFLQIFENATATRDDKKLSGVYIDIDASTIPKTKLPKDMLHMVDSMHLEQKKLFFELLSDDYLKTLDLKY